MKIVVSFAALILGLFIGIPGAMAATTAHSGPHAAEGCTYGSSSGNTQTCFGITGSGLYVGNMSVSSCVIASGSGRTLLQDITRNGTEILDSLGPRYVGPGHCYAPKLIWTINGDVSAGTYCGQTKRENSNGTYTVIGSECIRVFS